MGFPPFMGGPFRLIDAMGVDQIVATMERLAEKHGDRFTPTDLLYLHQKKGQKFYTG
jgi:3-hydroxyacyl-CoA dehydrogenase/enoyl-CoA hydratase/3-hydroxybutyryl-CoA epimerase